MGDGGGSGREGAEAVLLWQLPLDLLPWVLPTMPLACR